MTPEERVQQQLQALNSANRVRVYRARVKADVAAARLGPWEVLTSSHPLVQGMLVTDLLNAVPGFGRHRTRETMRAADVQASRTIERLTLRQRYALSEELRDCRERSTLWRRVEAAA